MTKITDQECHIGIDPGKSGGIALITNILDSTTKMPSTEADVSNWLWTAKEFTSTKFGGLFASIEKVHSMPGQGVRSMFTFGRNYGFLRGCLISLRIPFEEVMPRTWQKGLGIPVRKTNETKTQFKNRLKARAQQLFPEKTLTLATCDAVLIAEYSRRKRKGEL